MNFFVQDYVQMTGRIDVKLLKKDLHRITAEDFAVQMPRIFLVAAPLVQGDLKKDEDVTNTMKFSRFSIQQQLRTTMNPEETESQSLNTSSVYYLYQHSNDVLARQDEFHIGRMQPNELVMADYTVSRKHAIIICEEENYKIIDCNSTNGTKLANLELEANVVEDIRPGMKLSIGRLEFVIMRAEELYELLT